jgi:hypothetical protein
MGRAGREVALARFSEGAFVDRFEQLHQELYQKSLKANGN